ncbi:MAG: TIGR00266 family protein [Anaerolineales bacterium]|nr:TIGR00266 family protein [Anaerolineales bacterium]
MPDEIAYKIYGDDLQLLEIELDPGEAVRGEAGTMTYMEAGIEMQTGVGGIFKGLKRMFTGESFFISTFSNISQDVSHVAFAAPYPGSILPLNLSAEGGKFICQKDSFLCADPSVEIEIAFTKRLGAGLFGGEGFILQRLEGSGMAWVHAGGTLIEKTLAAGETLQVDTGCLVAFAPTVDYDIKMMRGFTNALFAGEGLFLAQLTGPGKVYLQSLPLSRLADRILAGAKRNKGKAGGVAGDVIGGLFGG